MSEHAEPVWSGPRQASNRLRSIGETILEVGRGHCAG